MTADLIRDALRKEPASNLDVGRVALTEGLGWRPDAMIGQECIVQIVTEPILHGYLKRRIDAAKSCGYQVGVAIPRELLWEEEFVLSLIEMDVDIRTYNADDHSIEDKKRPSVAVADFGIRVGFESRNRAITLELERARSAQNIYDKGCRFEALLGLLFSQVHGIQVVEHRLRTATEELDLVLQKEDIDRGRCWNNAGGPLILVEAKNWSSRIGQQEISVFWTKMRGKRRMARIGIFASIEGFTKDAKSQILRFSDDDYVMVALDGARIEDLAAARDLDASFDDLVRRAMLD